MSTINFPNDPVENQIYTKANRSWTWTGVYWKATSTTVGFTGSKGESSYISNNLPPANPAVGDRWFNTTDGLELVWTVDEDSSQWVEVAASGFPGEIGFTGSQGIPGEYAAFGYTGSQGSGFTGSVGFVGSQGDAGPAGGYTGSSGGPGYSGSIGDIGYVGSSGYTGSSGAYAAVGFTGSIGGIGYSGSLGYTGSSGAYAAVGFTGSLGYTGSAGTTIPVVQKTASYTLQLSDNGGIISITTGGVTVPANIFSAGMNISIYNKSPSTQNITQGTSVTMYLAGASNITTGNRTLNPYGIATIICIESNSFVITGAGLN